MSARIAFLLDSSVLCVVVWSRAQSQVGLVEQCEPSMLSGSESIIEVIEVVSGQRDAGWGTAKHCRGESQALHRPSTAKTHQESNGQLKRTIGTA